MVPVTSRLIVRIIGTGSYTEVDSPSPECRDDLRHEPVEVPAQRVQGPEEAGDEQPVRPGGLELAELPADLVRGARQAGVPRIGNVTTQARGDGLRESVHLVLPVRDEQ